MIGNVNEVHALKCEQPWFDDIIDGRKRFELRSQADRRFGPGDHVIFLEVEDREPIESETEGGMKVTTVPPPRLTGNVSPLFLITYVMEDNEGRWLLGAHCAFQFEPVV